MNQPGSISRFLQFIRFSHTIFALPFALGAMLVAAKGLPSWRVILLIVLCMIFARTAAMTFNRIADWEIDQRNPRTEGRHRLTSKPVAMGACLLSSLLFVFCSSLINTVCSWLALPALGIVFFYSLTKRFTALAQFFLGFALAVAPVGAWLAVTGEFALPPLLLALGVMLWVAGFDTIYATQDVECDRNEGLRSLVVLLGVKRALIVALLLHFGAFLSFVGFGVIARLGYPYYLGLIVMLVAFIYEHHAARRLDLEGINRAFFASNAVVSFVFVVSIAFSILLAP